jgi:hypothetical protein
MRCLWCHKSWSNEWRMCPACGAQLDPEDGPAAVPGFRPADQEPFTRTSTFVLRRLSVGGSIVYQGHEGRIEANVVPQTHNGRARLACVDVDGDLIFSLETYDAAEKAFTARAPHGDALATYLQQGTMLEPAVLVRDSTSAPAATLRPKRGGLDTFELHETGGAKLAVCWREDIELGHFLDDRWCVSVYDEQTRALPRLALVALPLVCIILFGRPARALPTPEQERAGERLSDLFDTFLS